MEAEEIGLNSLTIFVEVEKIALDLEELLQRMNGLSVSLGVCLLDIFSNSFLLWLQQ